MFSDDVEQGQANIDAEILQLEARILALRSSRNALSRAYRLPAEVVSEIFGWIQLLWKNDGVEHLKKWTRVTHVSRHWRHIALGCHTLWSDLPLDCVSYLEEAIKRSGGVALSILDMYDQDAYAYRRHFPRLKSLVLSASSRLRKIVLATDTTKEFLPELAELIPQSLEELALGNWDRATAAFFPKSLRSLKLVRSAFQWDWLQLPHLTELFILTSNVDHQISVVSFLKLVNQMPFLTSLSVGVIFTEDLNPAELVGDPTPCCPRLSNVAVHGTLPATTYFLSQIRLSEDFILKVGVNSADESPISGFVQCVNKHLQASQRAICIADIRYTEPDNSFLDVNCRQEGHAPAFLSITLGGPGRVPHHWVKSIQGLPLDRLEGLTGNVIHEPNHWRDSVFKDLKNLSWIIFNDSPSSTSFLNYIVEEANLAKASKSWGLPPFPMLVSLVVVGVRFTREMKVGVKAYLEAKATLVQQMCVLIFSDSKVSDDAVKQLQKVVPCVQRGGPLATLEIHPPPSNSD